MAVPFDVVDYCSPLHTKRAGKDSKKIFKIHLKSSALGAYRDKYAEKRFMIRSSDDWIPTRQSLLSRLRVWDDRDSWEEFFNTYWKLIYNVALKSGLTEPEAQDVVQETVIVVAKQMPEFKYDPSKGSFKGWLLKTTQWRISDQFRKRLRAVPLADKSDTTDQTPEQRTQEGLRQEAAGVEHHWDELWEKNLLETAVERVKQRVDPREFQMFELAANRGLAPLKIAQMLNVTRAHVYYARHKVARMIRLEVERLEDAAHFSGKNANRR